MNRVCKYCGIEKPIELFHSAHGYYCHDCKECHRERRKAYYQENKDMIKAKTNKYYHANKEKVAERRKSLRQTKVYKDYVKEYREKNREIILMQKRASNHRHIETYKKWCKEHEAELVEKRRIYNDKIRERRIAYIKNRKKENPLFKLGLTLRSRIYIALKRKMWRKDSPFKKILGADIDTVKSHIESLFKEGMTWDNHGEWHIDHIIPLATATTEDEMYKLFHYTNLQPLWAHDNLVKSKNPNTRQVKHKV